VVVVVGVALQRIQVELFVHQLDVCPEHVLRCHRLVLGGVLQGAQTLDPVVIAFAKEPDGLATSTQALDDLLGRDFASLAVVLGLGCTS